MIDQLDKNKPVQWTDESGAHHVGKFACARHEPGVEKAPVWNERGNYLIAHSHTGELEFVNPDRLSQYPSEPIPEPFDRDAAKRFLASGA